MREILAKKVDEREQTREHIQEIVSEQQQLQTQHMRYMRPSTSMSGGGMMSSGLAAVHSHQQVMCDDNAPVDVVGGGVNVMGHGMVSRRRVKNETDLEWDPFEMILHVHGNEAAGN